MKLKLFWSLVFHFVMAVQLSGSQSNEYSGAQDFNFCHCWLGITLHRQTDGQTYTCMHACAHTFSHIRICTHFDTHTCTHTHTLLHTHTDMVHVLTQLHLLPHTHKCNYLCQQSLCQLGSPVRVGFGLWWDWLMAGTWNTGLSGTGSPWEVSCFTVEQY